MTEEVNWQDFDKLHVIRRLRQLVGKWWKIQINFTDEKGFLRGVPEGKFFNPLNTICQQVTGDAKGFSSCMGTAKKTTVDATGAKKPKLGRCHAGFSTLSVPIRVNGKFMGCVFGDGFVVSETEREQKVLIKNFMQRSFSDAKDLDARVEALPVLTEKEVEYLTELIEVVVDEFLMTQQNLSKAQKKVVELQGELGVRYGFDQMIGKSGAMQSLYRLLDRVCDSDTTVLVQGQNGTGKELIAKALHYNSKRRKNKFLVVNCGAFNENLLESTLFGHVKGSFTGAIKDQKGLFEAADNGTLFLDEIGDTSMPMQVKLLRVLQEGTFTPVGSTVMRSSNVRVVAATNKDLAGMVKRGEFREDLYYRLNVINVVVPPLKERKEDISILSDHFLDSFSKSGNSPRKTLSTECLQALLNYEWPGNVRELENEIERLCVLAGSDTALQADFLSERIRESVGAKFPGYRVEGRLKEALEALEKDMIMEGLKRTRWNKSKLAKELGISRAGLIMKVEKYGFDKRNI
jgi:transcriptional regulator with PAS, ATPase and Fis domain